MIIDATFWVAISFFLFFGLLVYFKIPQKINETLSGLINNIKNEIEESEKLRNEARPLLENAQIILDSAKKEKDKIINQSKNEQGAAVFLESVFLLNYRFDKYQKQKKLRIAS